MKSANRIDTQKLVLLALLTAIVAVLTALAAVLPIFPFTVNLALIPMVIGAALIGAYAGAWLGLVFGFVVLITGNAALFFPIDLFGTVLVVLLKGALSGLAAGLVYKSLAKKSKTIAVVLAAIVSPVVNSGIFAAGVYVFFLPEVTAWGVSAGFTNVTAYLFLGMIGINFLFELGFNVVLSPVIVRLVQFGQKKRA